MSNNRNITVLYAGSDGEQLVSTLVPALKESGAMSYVRVGGGVDASRSQLNPVRFPGEVVDVTPTQRDVDVASSQDDNHERVSSRLYSGMVDKTVNAYTRTRVTQGALLAALDWQVIPEMVSPLTEAKNRLPQHPIMLVTTLPSPDMRGVNNKNVQAGIATLYTLWQEGVIDTTMMLDRISSFALAWGDLMQDTFLAKALASLPIAVLHDRANPTLAQLAERMRMSGVPFVGVSMASALVASGQSSAIWTAFHAVNKNAPERGGSDLHDALVQAKDLLTRVVEDEDTRASAGAIDTSKPFWVLFNVPFRDKRFQAFTNTMRPYVKRTYPYATPIIVQGGGTPDVQKASGYFIQVTLFYPLAISPDTTSPASLETLDVSTEGKEGKGRSNGHRRASITN